MKRKFTFNLFVLVTAFCVLSIVGFAQEETKPQTEQNEGRPRVTQSPSPQKDEKSIDAEQKDKNLSDVPEQIRNNRTTQMMEEESAIIPYYNNFFTNYYLGPDDVISVDVFNLERYSRKNITVPPNGKITLPLIREITVVGKTTDQVADEVAKKLEEYVIDPKVAVSLDKAMSARYSVLGDVGQAGIKIMTRRLTVYEAIAEAGGVGKTGDKKRVVILRRQPEGQIKGNDFPCTGRPNRCARKENQHSRSNREVHKHSNFCEFVQRFLITQKEQRT
jgi:protein involved in polysaccharide export with SLBB domain